MKTKAAVIREPGPDKWWEITELDLDPPKEREVLIRFKASGLCHSDDHIRQGDAPVRVPMVGGHEGAGVVEAAGPGVTRVKEGDHVVCSYIPVCGHCRYCSTGHQNLCNAGLYAGVGCLPDQTFRFHDGDLDLGGMCVLGTFSQYAVVHETSCVPMVDKYIPFEPAALVGCGVTTGWSSAVHAGGTRAGDTVVVFGCGGVGINAVQGARYAGAKYVVAVDPVDFKLEMAQKLGATHVVSDPAKAKDLIREITWGQLADVGVITVGYLTPEVVQQAVECTGKASTVVVTAVGQRDSAVGVGQLIGFHKRVQGSLFGGANPLYDIPKLLGLYQAGDLKLDELITQRYTLEQINDGYRAMLDGKNIRGVIVHE